MTAMRAWWMAASATGTALEQRDVDVPDPGPGQLLVRLHAAALNRGEFLAAHGTRGASGDWKAIGNEGAGLSPALRAQADLQVTIPMPGGMESLNAAAAAAVVLFEAVRGERAAAVSS